MATIYAGSYITIAATGADHPEEGLFHPKPLPTEISTITVDGNQKNAFYSATFEAC
jgi:hypothetical protein